MEALKEYREVEVLLSDKARDRGVDAQEEEDCSTDGTSPATSAPVDQSQMSTVEMDESAPEEVHPSEQEVSPPDEVSPSEEEVSPSEADQDPAQPKVERDSEKREEPEGDTDLNSQSVDELLADWREDLEAFQQMEKDEL